MDLAVVRVLVFLEELQERLCVFDDLFDLVHVVKHFLNAVRLFNVERAHVPVDLLLQLATGFDHCDWREAILLFAKMYDESQVFGHAAEDSCDFLKVFDETSHQLELSGFLDDHSEVLDF